MQTWFEKTLKYHSCFSHHVYISSIYLGHGTQDKYPAAKNPLQCLA